MQACHTLNSALVEEEEFTASCETARVVQMCQGCTDVPGSYRCARVVQMCQGCTDVPGLYRCARVVSDLVKNISTKR